MAPGRGAARSGRRAAGQRAIDLGCGPARIIELLCYRVGPAGPVVGLDLDPVVLSRARALASERGLSNAKIMPGDARRTGLPSSSFDVVHDRTPLVNIPDPAAVVAEMTRLARPGGWVAGRNQTCLACCATRHCQHGTGWPRSRWPPSRRTARTVHRPPGARAVPPGRPDRCRGRSTRRAVPGGPLTADHAPGPGAKHASQDRKPGDRRRAGSWTNWTALPGLISTTRTRW